MTGYRLEEQLLNMQTNVENVSKECLKVLGETNQRNIDIKNKLESFLAGGVTIDEKILFKNGRDNLDKIAIGSQRLQMLPDGNVDIGQLQFEGSLAHEYMNAQQITYTAQARKKEYKVYLVAYLAFKSDQPEKMVTFLAGYRSPKLMRDEKAVYVPLRQPNGKNYFTANIKTQAVIPTPTSTATSPNEKVMPMDLITGWNRIELEILPVNYIAFAPTQLVLLNGETDILYCMGVGYCVKFFGGN